jgi:tetratricopeptide (TPR) repeat protein
MDKKYEEAVKFYSKSLDAEMLDPRLPKDKRLILIDNLGTSYGLTGRTEEAKQIFRFGISEFPEYPMFYYNLACAYAESGDIKKALESLKSAYKFKANMPKGEVMPDPAGDPSFRKYLDNPDFRHFLKSVS